MWLEEAGRRGAPSLSLPGPPGPSQLPGLCFTVLCPGRPGAARCDLLACLPPGAGGSGPQPPPRAALLTARDGWTLVEGVHE